MQPTRQAGHLSRNSRNAKRIAALRTGHGQRAGAHRVAHGVLREHADRLALGSHTARRHQRQAIAAPRRRGRGRGVSRRLSARACSSGSRGRRSTPTLRIERGGRLVEQADARVPGRNQPFPDPLAHAGGAPDHWTLAQVLDVGPRRHVQGRQPSERQPLGFAREADNGYALLSATSRLDIGPGALLRRPDARVILRRPATGPIRSGTGSQTGSPHRQRARSSAG